jgi:hypothetical protein
MLLKDSICWKVAEQAACGRQRFRWFTWKSEPAREKLRHFLQGSNAETPTLFVNDCSGFPAPRPAAYWMQ